MKVLKFAGGVPSAKLNAPPNSCIPSKAKMRINRKRRNNRDRMERIELSRDITRLRNEDQYLQMIKALFQKNSSTRGTNFLNKRKETFYMPTQGSLCR